jgi:hypothetical protein
MKNNSYSTILEINQSPEIVFSAICHITNWWSHDFIGKSENLDDEFVIHHPNQHYSKQKLIEFIPNESIVWLVTESRLYWLKGNQQEWTGTKMDFKISHKENKLRLEFTHEGLTPDMECYNMCEQGWNIVIKDWLHHYITTGKPSPAMEQAAEIRNRHFENSTK